MNRYQQAKQWLKEHPDVKIEQRSIYDVGNQKHRPLLIFYRIRNDGTRENLTTSKGPEIARKAWGNPNTTKGCVIAGVRRLQRIEDCQSGNE